MANTRVELRQQIIKWYEDPRSPCIFWLNGMAGTGKSTIARTVAHELAQKKILAASFFFSRGRGDISHAGKFFTTIATQLANHVHLPGLRSLISKAIEENPDVDKQMLRDQWQLLIYNPLTKVPAQLIQAQSIQLVVVIDALDECDKKEDIQLILQLLTQAKNLETIRLRVFVTSRPDTPILGGFRKMAREMHQDFVLHEIPPPTVNHDISIFLQQKLSLVKAEHGLRTPWPGESIIQLLVERAAGLFIYAATTYRFIHSDRYCPEEQLSIILKEDTSAQSPTWHLDEMYTNLLQHSIIGKQIQRPAEVGQLLSQFRQIVGSVVIMFDVMAIQDLAGVLGLPTAKVKSFIAPLRSVLKIPGIESQPVRIFHPSFRDFLLNQQRCLDERFWIDEKERHIELFRNCLQLMSSRLRKDICSIRELGFMMADHETSYLNDMIQSSITPDIQYSCRYWVYHFEQGKSIEEDNDCDRILQFLRQHFLHWLEVLGLIGEVPEGVCMIVALEQKLQVSWAPCFMQCPPYHDLLLRAAIDLIKKQAMPIAN